MPSAMSSECKLTTDQVNVQISISHTDLLEFSELVEQTKSLARQLLVEWTRCQQQQLLQELLGSKWQRLADDQIGIACPECGSIALRRKAWRDRQMAVSGFGTVRIPRRQLSCSDCGCCWMPFTEELRIPSKAYDTELLGQAVDRLLESSYRKASEAVESGPSAATLHRHIQQLPQPDSPDDAQQVVCDGTELPAWRRQGQINVSLAHQIGSPAGKVAPNGRPAPRPRKVVAVTAGNEAALKQALEPVEVQALIHDGNLQLAGQATHVGRCRWHVPYTVKYLLYQDEIRGSDNKDRVEGLRERLRAIYGGREALTEELTGWLEANGDAPKACRHVAGSLEGLRSIAAHPEAFTVTTTSHLEREMVEVNKRFENGGGWTPEGARKLLWLHQLNRYEPERYEQVKRDLIERTVFPN